MTEVVVPIGVLWILLLVVDQVRRLIAHAILNKTIRKAMDADPTSVPLLIAKIETRPRWATGLAGWILLVAGVALAAMTPFASVAGRTDAWQLAVLSGTVGLGILAYAWWVARTTPHV
jgi:hypothetical protein